MSTRPSAVKFEIASITDRGLSQKRPLNEDSLLVDAERRIFVVADGVGGAQAGEVASRTAVEVLGEAFRHHQDGDDIEDLMEIAIQRANASIYQMSHEQQQLSTMATTIVALHLDGHQATIGHVGDSRLYRLMPDGRLQRETEDHSVVEEEVRAGRMSPEQAAHHPSRNVISRALGAEQSVEVDMKTIEVEDGTIFLLCSDGITRHIPDGEISALLRGEKSLEAACAVMKQRCYERGAEDNLTAVIVRVGASAQTTQSTADEDERTLLTQRAVQPPADVTPSPNLAQTTTLLQRPFDEVASANADPADTASAPTESKIRVANEQGVPASFARTQPGRGSTGRASRWFGVLFLLLIASAAAFYGGIRYQQNKTAAADNLAAFVPTPTPTPAESNDEIYERLKTAVDASPNAEAQRMAGENGGRPLDSNDPMFLALYGRALFLSGRDREASIALRMANEKIDAQFPPGRIPIRLDTCMTRAAAALRTQNAGEMILAHDSLKHIIEGQGGTGAIGGSPIPTPSPNR
ncbi:MAG: Stp1/IreP family PP2C-type Ser/Thr phosphatase [Pyrinomonadaceae bacterium]